MGEEGEGLLLKGRLAREKESWGEGIVYVVHEGRKGRGEKEG